MHSRYLLRECHQAGASTAQAIPEGRLCPPAQSIQRINSMPYLKLIFFFQPFGLLLTSLRCPERCLFHHAKPFISLSQHVHGYWDFCHLCSECRAPVSLGGASADHKVASTTYEPKKFANKTAWAALLVNSECCIR